MVLETGVQSINQSQVESYPKLKRWYLMPPYSNTQHYKVRIKGKGSKPWKGVVPSQRLCIVAIKKGAFESPSNMVGQIVHISCSSLKSTCITIASI